MSTCPTEDLPAMFATLSSYESLYGPYHPQTLALTACVADACRQARQTELARALLERVVVDCRRHCSAEHELRLRSIVTLRDLLIEQHDFARAAVLQREYAECQMRRFGSEHPETVEARSYLAEIVFSDADRGSGRTT